MGAFDFIRQVQRYEASAYDIRRLEARHQFLIEPFSHVLNGARVLDLAAHDGRWSYALAQAGAAEVVGIEARPELVERFKQFPDNEISRRVDLRVGDLYEGLHALVRRGERFDVVALFGIMYHVMDHFSILKQALELGPDLIIIDSEFMKGRNPYIQLIKEDPRKDLNAAPQIPDQDMAIKGVLSSIAMERIAEALNCEIQWMEWEGLAQSQRGAVGDYFRDEEHNMLRRTCVLAPRNKPLNPARPLVGDGDVAEVLLDYIHRYGLSDKARRLFPNGKT